MEAIRHWHNSAESEREREGCTAHKRCIWCRFDFAAIKDKGKKKSFKTKKGEGMSCSCFSMYRSKFIGSAAILSVQLLITIRRKLFLRQTRSWTNIPREPNYLRGLILFESRCISSFIVCFIHLKQYEQAGGIQRWVKVRLGIQLTW